MTNRTKSLYQPSAMQTTFGQLFNLNRITFSPRFIALAIVLLHVQLILSADEPTYTRRRVKTYPPGQSSLRIFRYPHANMRKKGKTTIIRRPASRVMPDDSRIPGFRTKYVYPEFSRYLHPIRTRRRNITVATIPRTTTQADTTASTTTTTTTATVPTSTTTTTTTSTTTTTTTPATTTTTTTTAPTTTTTTTDPTTTKSIKTTTSTTTQEAATQARAETTMAVQTTEKPLTKTITTARRTTKATTARPTTTTPKRVATTTTQGRKKPNRRIGTRFNGIPFRRRVNKDIDFNELIRKLDIFIAYYPSVREAASRLTGMMSKYEQASRDDRLRIWKGVFRVKSDLRRVNGKCNAVFRNVTEVSGRLIRQTKTFESYQEVAHRKVKDIETHQETQDDQYNDLFQRVKNNTRDFQRLSSDMAVLLPIVGNLMENYERNNLEEKKALEMLDSHARGNIADMSNQILVQQNTLESLESQVRSEMDLLYEEKQSMAKRLEQHQRRLTDTVNTHLSSHIRQINKIEGSLNRQGEKIKFVTTMMHKHDDMLDSNQALVLAFMDRVANTSEGLDKIKSNITRFRRDYDRTEVELGSAKEDLTRLEENTRQLASSLNTQHEVIGETLGRVNITEQGLRSVSSELDAYKLKQDAETEGMREDLDEVLARQREHQENITSLFSWNAQPSGRSFIDNYPSDEPEPASASVTPHELRALLTEIGVEDRMSRFTRVLRHQQQRMSNVTRAVLRLAEDNEAITTTSSHYFNLITSQDKLIRDQNETINKLAMIAAKQGDTIKTLSNELSSGQDMVMKLTNILVNVATQMKNPMGSQRDCHDVWLNGNKKSGVYNVIENMRLRPVQCNMTEYGGWTVIQRRKDGSQDFDRTMKEYQDGFGDIYGEHWLGLDSIKTFTQKVRASVGLEVVMEDWGGNIRTATYSQFYLYGKMYKLALGGYEGDAGDSLLHSNGLPFTAKTSQNDFTSGSCNAQRSAGWWFSSPADDCGETNLNGVYRKGPTQDARVSSTVFWKQWHGVGYPLKSVTMQIIPTDVVNKMREAELRGRAKASKGLNAFASPSHGSNAHSGPSAGINGYYTETNDDVSYKNNILNDHPYLEQKYGIQSGSQSVPSYQDDVQRSAVVEPPIDYDNFDYNAFLNNG